MNEELLNEVAIKLLYMQQKVIKFKRKWKRCEIIFLLERLELYISSGLTIDKALKISKDGALKKQRNDIENVCRSVEAGNLLSHSLLQFVGISNTTVGLIENGESSGDLSKALLVAKSILETEDELFKKCTSAMVYPIVIGIFAILLTIGLVKGIMPQIIPMLKSLHVELPLLTRIVISLSEGLTKYGIYVSIGLIVVLFIFYYLYKKFIFVCKVFHTIFMHIPILGSLLNNYSITIFLRSLGSLVESGLSITKSYAKTSSVISLLPLRESMLSEIKNISNGIPLGDIIAKKKMPQFVAPLIHAGEASGTLGNSLLRASLILDRDIENILRKITALIEPIMMAGMGCIVGSIALSIMMPIYDISKVLQK